MHIASLHSAEKMYLAAYDTIVFVSEKLRRCLADFRLTFCLCWTGKVNVKFLEAWNHFGEIQAAISLHI